MIAELIAVGSEMLTPDRVDTNSSWLTEALNEIGIDVGARSIVGDDVGWLEQTVRQAVQRSGLVITTGGLGPTEDDVTREAVSRAVGRALHQNDDVLSALRDKFERRGRVMADNNARQALVMEGAEVLSNEQGTAPGQWLELEGGCRLVILPGPPKEMKPMFTDQVLTRLVGSSHRILRRVLKVNGLGESNMDALIAPIYTTYSNPTTTVLFTGKDLEIHLTARAPSLEQCRSLLDELTDKLAHALGPNLSSRRGESLQEVVGRGLLENNWTLVTAESVTGGLIAERISQVSGASQYFLGAFVTYVDAMKEGVLGIDEDLLAGKGAVSPEVAEAMALGALQRTGANLAVSATGFAGPTGGTEADPIGTVYIGVADRDGVYHRRFALLGDRELIRLRASQAALDLLRRRYFL